MIIVRTYFEYHKRLYRPYYDGSKNVTMDYKIRIKNNMDIVRGNDKICNDYKL